VLPVGVLVLPLADPAGPPGVIAYVTLNVWFTELVKKNEKVGTCVWASALQMTSM